MIAKRCLGRGGSWECCLFCYTGWQTLLQHAEKNGTWLTSSRCDENVHTLHWLKLEPRFLSSRAHPNMHLTEQSPLYYTPQHTQTQSPVMGRGLPNAFSCTPGARWRGQARGRPRSWRAWPAAQHSSVRSASRGHWHRLFQDLHCRRQPLAGLGRTVLHRG